MLNDECMNYIKLYESGSPENVELHRFKIEAVCISPTQYNDLKNIKSNSRSNEYNRVLESSEEKSISKYKVKYSYPSTSQTTGAARNNPGGPNNNTPMTTKNGSKTPTTAAGAASTTTPTNDPNSIDSILSELQTLRTSYDKVLELTVNLTAEKDTMIAKLESKQNERKEKSKLIEKERKGTKGGMAGAMKKRGLFSYTFMVVAAILAFFIGYYLDRKAFLDGILASTKLSEL